MQLSCNKGLRVAAIVLGAMTVLTAVCSGAGWLLVRHFDEAIGGAWSTEPVSVTKARDLFGLDALPAEVLQTQQREGGFQDSFFDALLRIPKGSEEVFLKANGLERDTPEHSTAPVDQFEARIRAIASPKGAMRVTPLMGVRDAHLSDGGTLAEFRNASLLEFDDQLWLALEAFDT